MGDSSWGSQTGATPSFTYKGGTAGTSSDIGQVIINSPLVKKLVEDLVWGTNMYPSAALLGNDKDSSIASLPIDELIEKADGFAGVFPEHKYEIVKRLQDKKHVVGMTGDGVNDAPALKKADIGTAVDDAIDAARSASDVVLTGLWHRVWIDI